MADQKASTTVQEVEESEIHHLWIRDCAVSSEDIKDMASRISKSTSNEFSVEFQDCALKADHLKLLCDEIKDTSCQMTTLTISFMDDVNDLLEKACFIVGKYKTKYLSFEYDELDDESIELFQDCLEKTKIESLESLDISYNNDISAAGFERLGKIMSKFNIVSLTATDCDIADEKLKKFLDALNGAKLKGLDIGRNRKLTNEGYKTIAKFIANKGVNRLDLSGCQLCKENIDIFHQFLPETGQESLLEELNLSYNSTMEPDGSLGSLVAKCGVTKLSMAGCKLSEYHLFCFREAMENHTMNMVNMRDNSSIGQGIEEVAEFVKQCKIRELNICDCMFSGPELDRFRKSLGDAKVSRLHLGDREREPDKRYVEELCTLLGNVRDVLYLRFYKLRSDFHTSLKIHSRNAAKIYLRVGDKKEEICGNKRNWSKT